MNSVRNMKVNTEQPSTLWTLLSSDDESGVSLPYNGSSGWSGTDTSKDRADHADSSGKTRSTQNQTLGHIYLERERGMTWKEIADITGWHHGTVSGALSVLHKTGRIARLTEKRGQCRVYVCPEYVNGRVTDAQGRKPKRTYEQGLRDAVEAVYGDCHHTKYEGCQPCIHDEIANAIEALGETND